MNRSTRTLIVVAVAVAVASAATYLVFMALKSRPAREVEVASAFAVVAAKPLPVGARIKADDVKVVPWPAANLVPGGFAKAEEVVGRGVISSVAVNEPLSGNNIASKEMGAGLPAMIPEGMRAVTISVNAVVGVAGFVSPGTRVDVMVILRQGTDGLARVVVNNVLVLAADANRDQSAAREGNSIQSSVVTLLASPKDAERITLAGAQGQLMLTLRNPLDTAPAESNGTRIANLFSDASGAAPAPAAGRPAPRRATPPPPPVAAPPPAPKPYVVETIRAAQRTEDSIK
jgi:pilus assembly protein CpaB